jgi:hypothetical protein
MFVYLVHISVLCGRVACNVILKSLRGRIISLDLNAMVCTGQGAAGVVDITTSLAVLHED